MKVLLILGNITSFDKYYKKVKDIIATQFYDGYLIDTIQAFKILIWWFISKTKT